MKNEFVDFIEKLIEANPKVAEELMTPTIENYLTTLRVQEEKPEITDNGKLILGYMQENTSSVLLKSKDIAEGLYISSRAVSGSMRKLVTDGFVEKIGQNPAVYTLTEKGKNYNIEGENE